MGATLTLADLSFRTPRSKTVEGKDLAKLIGFGGLADVVYSLYGLASLIDQDSLEGVELRHVCVTLRTLAEAIDPDNVTLTDVRRCEVVVTAEPDDASTPPEDGGGNVRALRRPEGA